MIIIYHIAGRVVTVENLLGYPILHHKTQVLDVLFECAAQHPEKFIVWCSEKARASIDLKALQTLFHHNRLMLSYGDVSQPYLTEDIGYIEDSPFLKVPPDVTYPTWQMHSYVGGIHAKVLNQAGEQLNRRMTLDFFLNTLSRKLQPQGLICLSEPRLLKAESPTASERASMQELYTFIRQNYKKRWLFFMLIMQMRYERIFAFPFFLRALFLKKRTTLVVDFDQINFISNQGLKSPFTVDVIIPTLGRREYLYNVLLDFKNQDALPKSIIIVEQNPDPKSVSSLDFIKQEEWPFKILHTFTHRTGACNARNLALSQSTSDWVFLFDDDGRFNSDLLTRVREVLKITAAHCINLSYLQKDEVEKNKQIVQWPYFGSGCSIVHRDIIDWVGFDMALEHGYGEDVDFGMQIRSKGSDVLYIPSVQITHLKAPVGGFRSVPSFPWKNDKIQPKPSPQIMYHRRKNTTAQQLKGFKWVLFFKYYRSQSIKNPIAYTRYYRNAWSRSNYWASKLPVDV